MKVFQFAGIEVGGTGGVIVASLVSVACLGNIVPLGVALVDKVVGLGLGDEVDIVEDVETG